MSELSLFKAGDVPAFVKSRGELGAVAKALAGGGAASGGKRVSIKGGVFRLISGGKEVAAIDERFLDVVIVAAAPKVSRVLYLKKWDPENPASPDCWSPDGEKPSADAENPQSSRCAECSMNVAGSGQGNSRACRYQQRIAVVLANDMKGDVLQLTLPATSVFGKPDGDNYPLQAYARQLAAQNIDPTDVVTRMRFDTKSESPKLFFKPTRWLTDDEHEVVAEQGASEDAKKAITMTVAKMDNVAPVAAPMLEGKPPAKAKAAKVEVAVVEDDSEPEVRKTEAKPNAVPKAKSSLAETLDDWDE